MAQVRKKSKDAFKITICAGKKPNGKRNFVYETFYGTEAQARRYADKLEKEIQQKIGSSKAIVMSVGELLNKWLENVKEEIEPSTYEVYARQAKKLIPVVGDLQLYELTTLELMERLKLLGDGLSPRTKRNHYATLRTALNWGAAFDVVRQDLMKGIRPPKVERKKRDVLNENELRRFIAVAKEYKYYLALRILAFTGMRIGELLGLRWANVFLDENRISIVEAVNIKSRQSKETKTATSLRNIHLDDETIRLLREHRKQAMKQSKGGMGFVFQSSDGRPLKYSSVYRTKERVLKKAGLHHIRIHDLRHGVGSILLDNGTPLTVVADMLGDRQETIVRVYAHSMRKGTGIAEIIDGKDNNEESSTGSTSK